MTFSTLKPADNQKIRLVPQDVRDNFTAIVNGDTSFTQDIANLAVQGADPAAFAASTRVYSKIGNGANPELFERNAAGDVVQITQDTKLGSDTTPLLGSSIQLDTSTPIVTFASANMIVACGRITSAGVLTYGVNMTSGGVSGNEYTVSVNADVLVNANYCVIATCASANTSSERIINITAQPAPVAGNPTLIKLAIVSGSGSSRTEAINIIVVGGR
jgi:hypothetical protein